MFGSKFASYWFRWNSRLRSKPARYRPVVLTLEDRCLLSTFQEFPLPPLQRNPQDEFHRERITTGSDGNLWFTDGVYGNAYVGRITPDGSVTEFPIEDNSFTQLYNITAGPDGNLWMLALRSTIGLEDERVVAIRLTPDGNYTAFDVSPNPFVSNVSPLVAGPDGNLWYTLSFYSGVPGTNEGTIVGHITPTGEVTNFSVGLNMAQEGVGGGITAGPDGNLWVEIGDGTHGETPGVREFSPDGQLSDVIPGSHALSQMVTDANGNVWGLVSPGQIERIAPDGTVSDFPLPAHEPFTPPELNPLRMTLTAGPDGNIWFSDPYANQIGNITPDGTVTEYAVPTPDSFPAGITTGPDGNIWFTELGSNQIGEFALDDGASTARAAPAKSAPLAQAVRSAAVDALFAGAQPDPLTPVVNQLPALATVNAAFAASQRDVIPAPPAKQPVATPHTVHHLHSESRAEAAAALTGPLALDPGEVQ